MRAITDALLRVDLSPRRLDRRSPGNRSKRVSASVLAREPGVAAGLEEFGFLLEAAWNLGRVREKGWRSVPGGRHAAASRRQTRTTLLSLERVGLNLLQRMSGIATLTRCLQERVRGRCAIHSYCRHAKDALGPARQARRASRRRRNAPDRTGRRDFDQEQSSRAAGQPRRGCGAARDRTGLEVSQARRRSSKSR